VVCFNAEYDALPGIGHACGHNLIAVSSLVSFIGLAAALKASGAPGRVRILGTPAEEGGGGKALLIEAGAYKDVDACMMAHPGPAFSVKDPSVSGSAYMTSLAMAKFTASFSGKPAHAAMAPYQGVNALDAATLSYNGISMLRQQTKEYDRIHAVVKEGGSYSNVIPDATLCEYQVRSKTRREALELRERVMNCAKGACLATGCTVEFEQ
jgi:amidohydrolase